MNQLAEGNRQRAFLGAREVQVGLQVRPQEKQHEGLDVQQALQDGVHEARVAEIVQADFELRHVKRRLGAFEHWCCCARRESTRRSVRTVWVAATAGLCQLTASRPLVLGGFLESTGGVYFWQTFLLHCIVVSWN